MGFTAPILKKLTTAERHMTGNSYVHFHPDLSRNKGITGTNLFKPLSLSLLYSQFSRNSHLPENFCKELLQRISSTPDKGKGVGVVSM